MLFEKKKKRPTGLIIIIAVIGVCCIFGGYLLKINGSFEEKKPEEVNKPEEKQEDVESMIKHAKQVSNLYDLVTSNAIYRCSDYRLFTDKKITYNDLSDENKIYMAISKIFSEEKTDVNATIIGTTYSKSKVENAVKELFGSNASVKHKSIKNCTRISYDSNEKQYVVDDAACVDMCGSYSTKGRIIKSSRNSDKIEITVRVIFGDNKKKKYYSDFNKTKVISVNINDKGAVDDKDYEKGSLYKIVFKEEKENNYIFSSIEPVK